MIARILLIICILVPSTQAFPEVEKRDDPTDFSIFANWSSCLTQQIEVEVHNTRGSQLNLQLEIDAIGDDESVKIVPLPVSGVSGITTYAIADSNLDHTVIFTDVDNPDVTGTILVKKCDYFVRVKWNDCDTNTVRIELDGVVPPFDTQIHFKMMLLSDPTTEVTLATSSIAANGATSNSNEFTIPTNQEDYLFEWWDVDDPNKSNTTIIRKCGGGSGDPHMSTFDGVHYDFQGYCSYTLIKDCINPAYPSFEITADFRGRRHVSKGPTTMVAINITGQGIPPIRLEEDNSYMVAGELHHHVSVELGYDAGSVSLEHEKVVVRIKKPNLVITWNGRPHKVMMGLNDLDLTGNVCGMLGNADGNPEDDFIKSDGYLTSDVNEFGNSWMVPGSCPF